MKKWLTGTTLLLLGCLGHPALAGLGLPIPITFSMPAGIDPRRLDLTSLNTPYLTDSGAGNPISGGPPIGPPLAITGNTLLTTGLGGLELHNGLTAGTTVPILEFDFVTTYQGDISLLSNNGGNPIGYTPWSFSDDGFIDGVRHFHYYYVTGSDPVYRNGDFAFLTAQLSGDPTSDAAFASARFAVVGFGSPSANPQYTGNPFAAVPEPGTIATLAGMLTAGSMVLLRRRTRKRFVLTSPSKEPIA